MSSAPWALQQEPVAETEAADLLAKTPAPAPRRAGLLTSVLGLLAAACAAAVLVSYRKRTSESEQFVGLAISTVFTELAAAAAAGEDVITIKDPSAVEIGDMLVVDANSEDKEWIRVLEVEGATLTLSLALSKGHAAGAVVSTSTHTVGDNATDMDKPYNLSVPLGVAASAGDKQVTLTAFCEEFEKGDEIKVEEEFNLIKNITLNDDGSCLLDLAFALAADHTTESILSKKIAAPPPTLTSTLPPTTTTVEPPTTKPTTTKKTTTKKDGKVEGASVHAASVNEKSACGGLPRVGLAVLIATCSAGAS